MSRAIRTLSIAVLAALPLGCTTSEPPPRQRPPADQGVYRRPPAYVEPPPGSVAKDIPLYDYGRREPVSSPPSQPPVADDRPLVDTTGVRLGELASVRAATIRPQQWQAVLPSIEDRIDAPDLKANARNGLAALAPRVARALIDFKGETAIVTIAVYRDPSPTTRPAAPATAPSTNPATQPVYKHAAIAIAFEGFAGQLDPSFIPRVLADQPRTPDDGREPIDFNLMLDREASSYVFYQLSRDGLMAGQVSHADLRRELADAVDKLGPATRPSTGQATPAVDSVAGIYEPVPAPGGVRYDTGEVWTTQRYGDYVYRGPDYYWGSGADPYLYDLYGCRWGSPYWVTRSGYYYDDYYYGSGFCYGSGYYGYWGGHGHHHDDDDDDDDDHHNGNNNGNGRPPVVVSDRSPRGKVPWGNAPIVSATNPPRSNGPTPLVIAAQPSGTPVRPAPTITGRPMKAPKEFVGPRSVGAGGTPSAASFRTADGSVLVVPSKSSQAQAVDSSPGDDGGSKAPIIVPARRSSPAYVAPSGTYTPPPAQRPSARSSTPSERINSAPRLGPSSNGNREFVGPRSNPGGDSGGGRSITGGNSGGGRSGGGDGGGSGGGGKSSGGGDGGGRSGGGGGGGGGNSGGGKGDGGGRNR